MIDAAKQGTPVDWSQLPSVDLSSVAGGISSLTSRVLETNVKEVETEPSTIPNDIMPVAVEVEEKSILPSPVPALPLPRTTLEALEQRLAKYQSIMQQAQEEGNSSKARRFGRIVKQYQDAIKLNKLGKPIPFDELPDPPGKSKLQNQISCYIVITWLAYIFNPIKIKIQDFHLFLGPRVK